MVGPTIGGMSEGMLYIGTRKCFRYPHFIILAENQKEAESKLRLYKHNLELGINFFEEDSKFSSDIFVQKNNKRIEHYKKGIEIVSADLVYGCREIEI